MWERCEGRSILTGVTGKHSFLNQMEPASNATSSAPLTPPTTDGAHLPTRLWSFGMETLIYSSLYGVDTGVRRY